MTEKASSNKTNTSKAPKNIKRWLFTTLLKLMVVSILGLGLYVIYLDGKVTQRFEGQRWQIPVTVYSEIITLANKQPLQLSELIQTLKLSGYRQVKHITAERQFSVNQNTLSFQQPAFVFPDQNTAKQRVTINFNHSIISKITADGKRVEQVKLVPSQIAKFVPSNREDRQLISLEQVPEQLLDTLLLVEDRNFYHHHGVSPLGILRAIYANLRAGRRVQGGSTLTQQLVKNMFLSNEKTLLRKFNEAIMALLLEYHYSKDQLLEAYINEVYLAQNGRDGIYGFALAAEHYFGQSLAELNVAQIALLIAEIKGPSYYNPWRHAKRASNRRDLVLRLMLENDMLTTKQYRWAVNQPLGIVTKPKRRKQQFPNYLQLVKQELHYLVPKAKRTAGVKVFTGLSLIKQHLLQQTVASQLVELEQQHQTTKLQAAMVLTNSQNGTIEALVGDKQQQFAGFNRATMAFRPIGSLIKPIIYTAALERYLEYNLATPLMDNPITLNNDGEPWQPKNYDGKYRQQVLLINALVHSYNVPTVNLGMALGLENLANALPMLGYGKSIDLKPSMLLGALNLSPLEINQVYLTLAAHGQFIAQHTIKTIVDSKQQVLYQVDETPEPRLSENASFLLNYSLHQVTQKGTAKSLTWRLKNRVTAGKTGTTNDLRDSWYIGYDNRHLITTWVGRDDNKPSKLTGSSGALVLFAKVMNQLPANNLTLTAPKTIDWFNFEQETGNAVASTCEHMIKLPAVISGITLTEQCLKPIKPKKKSWFDWLFGK